MKLTENAAGGLGICINMNGWGINIVEVVGEGSPKPVAISFLPVSCMSLPGLVGDLLTRQFIRVAEQHGKFGQLFCFVDDHEIFDKCQEMLKNLGPYGEFMKTLGKEMKEKKAEAQAKADAEMNNLVDK